MENLNLNLSVLNRLNVKKTGKHCKQWGVYAFRLIFFDYIYVLLLFKDSCTSVDRLSKPHIPTKTCLYLLNNCFKDCKVLK